MKKMNMVFTVEVEVADELVNSGLGLEVLEAIELKVLSMQNPSLRLVSVTKHGCSTFPKGITLCEANRQG